ncbi:MAG: phage portal protein [Verrucomicrobiota bacterium]|nr:phage portal protein [Verrucomicrobiota bacterium]
MKAIQKILNALSGPVTVSTPPIIPPIQSAIAVPAQKDFARDWLRGMESETGRRGMMTAPYLQSVWVYACVNILASNIAQVPFRISRGERKGEDILESGPAVELFRMPHKRMNRFKFWELYVTWQMLRGEVFIVRTDDGLLLLNPDHFQHVVVDHQLVAWRYTGFGMNTPLSSQIFLPEEVLHDPLPNPYDHWRGLSPLRVAMLAAETDYASAEFMKGLMQNNGDHGLVVTTDQQPSREQVEEIYAMIRQRERASGTAKRPMILWGGFKVEKPTISNVDLQYLEQRKYTRQEICAVFGVPQEMLGFTEDSNRSVSQSARLNFTENRIAPLCERIEAAMEPLVNEAGKGIYGWFDCDAMPIMQAARRERIDSGVKLFGMGVPFNEINQTLDLGFSRLPHGDKCFLPYSLMEVGTKTDKPKNPKAETNEEKWLRQIRARKAQTTPSLPAPSHTCGAGSEAYAASIAGSVRMKTSKMRRFFFEQRQRVITRLSETLAKNQKSLPDDLFDEAQEDSILLGRMKPLLLADLEFGGAQLWREIGLENFSVAPAEAIAFLKARENHITGINEETFRALAANLSEGLNRGETTEQLIERVKEIYNKASDGRAETIALTETNIAVNSGRFGAMKQAKVPKKGWQASNLENVRSTHIAAERDYELGIPLDQAFRVGGYELMHPGDPNGPAHEVINCRCFTFAILEEKAVKTGVLLSFDEFRLGKGTL